MFNRIRDVSRVVPGVGRAAQRSDARELDEILSSLAIHTLYQPIVALDSATTVGFEALARGPDGSSLQFPDALFATARREGRLTELDWTCRLAAVNGALRADLKRPMTLFVNVEPSVMHERMPERLRGWWEQTVGSDLAIMVEITERQLMSHPAQMLQTVGRVREYGWGVALDDVGADPRSLALMPLLRPDVIKLDMGLVQGKQRGAVVTEIVGAVHAEADRTGASVLAEGIENQTHFESAIALGATLGQGYLFARPEPLPDPPPRAASGVQMAERSGQSELASPFAVASAAQDARPATASTLERVAQRLEQEMPNIGESAVLLASFDDARPFHGEIKQKYERHAKRAALVAVASKAMASSPAKNVRGVPLEGDDPIAEEWVVIVLGPYFAGAVAGHKAQGKESSDQFEYVLTYERDLVIAMAESFVRRLAVRDELEHKGLTTAPQAST